MYIYFVQTPSAVDQLRKILSGKSECVSNQTFIVGIILTIFYSFECYRLVLKLVLNNGDAMV